MNYPTLTTLARSMYLAENPEGRFDAEDHSVINYWLRRAVDHDRTMFYIETTAMEPTNARENAMNDTSRRMPGRLNLGKQYASVMAAPMSRWRDHRPIEGVRHVMGFRLPTWQRGLVWTDSQKIAFIESAWRGIYLGTYTVNVTLDEGPYDGLLIDGQQRMHAIECYLRDEFPVFGWRWSEVTEVDRRVWEMTTIFSSYETETKDEQYLRNYYNMMNFGGTAHKESERA